MEFIKIKSSLSVILFSTLISGCATPITYYSLSPDASKPAKVQFIAQSGTYSTFSLYQQPATCKGLQVVSFYETNVNRTIFVPHTPYLTFSTYTQFPEITSIKYGISMYSVPFESGDLRIKTYYDANNIYTLIERKIDGGDWVKVKDAIKREYTQPFLESGDWCNTTKEIS